ncbi:hypothetical protein [Cellulosimicrobium funkei]
MSTDPAAVPNVLIELEWGKRSVLFERLYDLAAVLDVPIGTLLDDDPPAPGSVEARN